MLKNAQEDFSNLPEAYDPSISGKNRASGAAFIPENVKNEFSNIVAVVEINESLAVGRTVVFCLS